MFYEQGEDSGYGEGFGAIVLQLEAQAAARRIIWQLYNPHGEKQSHINCSLILYTLGFRL